MRLTNTWAMVKNAVYINIIIMRILLRIILRIIIIVAQRLRRSRRRRRRRRRRSRRRRRRRRKANAHPFLSCCPRSERWEETVLHKISKMETM